MIDEYKLYILKEKIKCIKKNYQNTFDLAACTMTGMKI